MEKQRPSLQRKQRRTCTPSKHIALVRSKAEASLLSPRTTSSKHIGNMNLHHSHTTTYLSRDTSNSGQPSVANNRLCAKVLIAGMSPTRGLHQLPNEIQDIILENLSVDQLLVLLYCSTTHAAAKRLLWRTVRLHVKEWSASERKSSEPSWYASVATKQWLLLFEPVAKAIISNRLHARSIQALSIAMPTSPRTMQGELWFTLVPTEYHGFSQLNAMFGYLTRLQSLTLFGRCADDPLLWRRQQSIETHRQMNTVAVVADCARQIMVPPTIQQLHVEEAFSHTVQDTIHNQMRPEVRSELFGSMINLASLTSIRLKTPYISWTPSDRKILQALEKCTSLKSFFLNHIEHELYPNVLLRLLHTLNKTPCEGLELIFLPTAHRVFNWPLKFVAPKLRTIRVPIRCVNCLFVAPSTGDQYQVEVLLDPRELLLDACKVFGSRADYDEAYKLKRSFMRMSGRASLAGDTRRWALTDWHVNESSRCDWLWFPNGEAKETWFRQMLA